MEKEKTIQKKTYAERDISKIREKLIRILKDSPMKLRIRVSYNIKTMQPNAPVFELTIIKKSGKDINGTSISMIKSEIKKEINENDLLFNQRDTKTLIIKISEHYVDEFLKSKNGIVTPVKESANFEGEPFAFEEDILRYIHKTTKLDKKDGLGNFQFETNFYENGGENWIIIVTCDYHVYQKISKAIRANTYYLERAVFNAPEKKIRLCICNNSNSLSIMENHPVMKDERVIAPEVELTGGGVSTGEKQIQPQDDQSPRDTTENKKLTFVNADLAYFESIVGETVPIDGRKPENSQKTVKTIEKETEKTEIMETTNNLVKKREIFAENTFSGMEKFFSGYDTRLKLITKKHTSRAKGFDISSSVIFRERVEDYLNKNNIGYDYFGKGRFTILYPSTALDGQETNIPPKSLDDLCKEVRESILIDICDKFSQQTYGQHGSSGVFTLDRAKRIVDDGSLEILVLDKNQKTVFLIKDIVENHKNRYGNNYIEKVDFDTNEFKIVIKFVLKYFGLEKWSGKKEKKGNTKNLTVMKKVNLEKPTPALMKLLKKDRLGVNQALSKSKPSFLSQIKKGIQRRNGVYYVKSQLGTVAKNLFWEILVLENENRAENFKGIFDVILRYYQQHKRGDLVELGKNDEEFKIIIKYKPAFFVTDKPLTEQKEKVTSNEKEKGNEIPKTKTDKNSLSKEDLLGALEIMIIGKLYEKLEKNGALCVQYTYGDNGRPKTASTLSLEQIKEIYTS
jgi:hypothetical protein